MHKSFRAAGVALGLMALTACSSKSENPKLSGSMDLSGLAADASVSPENKAEQYAKAAEQLAQSSAFSLAEPVIEKALSLDPSNKRAQFYQALLAQKMALRGALVRIKPLVRKNPDSVAQYNKAVSEIPKGALRDFLMDGQEDIKTEKDAQSFLDGMHEGREQLRKFLKENKDLALTLRLSDLISAGATQGATKQNCTYVQTGDMAYSYSCETIVVTEMKMNRADNEAMQQIVAGLQVYSTLLNSYDLTGSIETAKKIQNSSASGDAVIAELSKYSDFAKLRNQNISKLAELGMDAIAGVRWAAELQKELCPKGEGVPNQRSGYIFKDGICIDQDGSGKQDSLENVLQQIELALSGQINTVVINGIQTEVKYAAPILNPIEDIKMLGFKVDKCGHLIGIADSTAGGLLPNGDAVEVMAAGVSYSTCEQ